MTPFGSWGRYRTNQYRWKVTYRRFRRCKSRYNLTRLGGLEGTIQSVAKRSSSQYSPKGCRLARHSRSYHEYGCLFSIGDIVQRLIRTRWPLFATAWRPLCSPQQEIVIPIDLLVPDLLRAHAASDVYSGWLSDSVVRFISFRLRNRRVWASCPVSPDTHPRANTPPNTNLMVACSPRYWLLIRNLELSLRRFQEAHLLDNTSADRADTRARHN